MFSLRDVSPELAKRGSDPKPWHDGKRQHVSAEAAYQHLRSLQLSPAAKEPERLRVYLCNTCGFYHVGRSAFVPVPDEHH